jgi:hypothetical protein
MGSARLSPGHNTLHYCRVSTANTTSLCVLYLSVQVTIHCTTVVWVQRTLRLCALCSSQSRSQYTALLSCEYSEHYVSVRFVPLSPGHNTVHYCHVSTANTMSLCALYLLVQFTIHCSPVHNTLHYCHVSTANTMSLCALYLSMWTARTKPMQ